MKLSIITMAICLAGCATDPATVKTLVDAQHAANARPTLSIRCPQGCEAEYTDPRDRVSLQMPTNGWDAIKSVSRDMAGLVPIIVTGRIATAGFDALRNSGGTQTTNTTTTGAVTNTGPVSTVGDTTSMSGTGVLGSGQYSTQANPTTTTSTPVTTSTTLSGTGVMGAGSNGELPQ